MRPGIRLLLLVAIGGVASIKARLEILFDGIPRHGVPLTRVPSPEALSR
jgi:hypothetical protein